MTIASSGGLYVTAVGSRADEWRSVFGAAELPVLSILPIKVVIQGYGVREAYMLDVKRLKPAQLDGLVSYLAGHYPGDSPEFIREKMLTVGFPLTVDDNLVPPAIDMRFVI
jgi:hypothetical protein